MDYVSCAIVSAAIGFILGVLFGKHVVSEAQHIREHVTSGEIRLQSSIDGMESRIRNEITALKSKV
jgi:hypothetical protein